MGFNAYNPWCKCPRANDRRYDEILVEKKCRISSRLYDWLVIPRYAILYSALLYSIVLNRYERNTLSFCVTRMRIRLLWCVHIICMYACVCVCVKMRLYIGMYTMVHVYACLYTYTNTRVICSCGVDGNTWMQTHTHTHPKAWIASRSWNLWFPGKANPEINIGILCVCLLARSLLLLYEYLLIRFMCSPNGRVFGTNIEIPSICSNFTRPTWLYPEHFAL